MLKIAGKLKEHYHVMFSCEVYTLGPAMLPRLWMLFEISVSVRATTGFCRQAGVRAGTQE